MFTGSEDGRVRIWDIGASRTCKRVFDSLSPVLSVCLHPNQVELAIATSNASIFLWNISNDYNEQLCPETNPSVKLSSEFFFNEYVLILS
jgi:target of rapamycin complex subunit LST8